VRPAKCCAEAGDLWSKEIRFCGDDVEQFPGDDGIDGFAVAFREAFQGEDLKTGDAYVQVGEAEEFGDAFREVVAEGFFDRFLRPEVHAKEISSFRGTVMPRQVRTPSTSPLSIRSFSSSGSMPRISAASASE
jgi:hypothetical protein